MQERPVGSINWINWRAEIVTAIVVMVFIGFLGAAVGLIWHAVAPHVDIHAAINNPEEKTKALVGDDLWLGLIGLIAGILCVLALYVVAPDSLDGPGGLLGLVVGGFLAMLVADRVGYLVSGSSLRTTLNAAFPDATPQGIASVVRLLDFRVRSYAVVLSWPMASALVSALIVGVRSQNQPTMRPVPAYPGSP